MFFVLYHIVKHRRDVVRGNLNRSFPEKSEMEIKEIEKKFYKHFCDIAIESIKGLTMSKKLMSKRLKIKNLSLVEDLFKKNKSVIMYTAHIGNWEWLNVLPTMVPYKTQSFYQKISSNYYDQFMLDLRSRFGMNCIESNQGYRTMAKMKMDNELTLTCIIGDQSPREQSAKHWVQFLNQDTAFLKGTERIAKKLDQSIVFASFKKLKRGQYELEFKLLEEHPEKSSSEEIIERYAHSLEASIKSSPDLWLWSHKRWKLKNAA
jgi:KDO2-lipid IV(A) lauroyltransferase